MDTVLDKKRYFSAQERSIIYLIYNGKCDFCKVSLQDSFHVDHRIPHSKLGRTTLANAVALCGRCNLVKSDQLSYDYAMRSWQIAALNKTVEVAASGGQAFVTNACPGAGKTRYAISFLDWALDTEFADLIIYCSPSVELRDDVADRVEEFTKFKLSKVIDGSSFERVLVDGVPSRVSGFSITYQTLKSRYAVISALCERKKVVMICDEVHHAGLEKSWGDAVKEASSSAQFRLGMSGTPFRSDDVQIAFLNYDGAQGLPEYNFFYGQALAKGYVAPVQFSFRNALIRLVDPRAGDTPITLELRQDHGDSEGIKLRGAYAEGSRYSEAIIEQANAHLKSLHPTDGAAAGLVIASNISHADRIADYIRNTLNERCEIVHSDQDNRDKIKKFKKNKDQWIVSVGMISEGVDIPRLRVLVFLSAVTTRLYFHQAVGRVVRLHHQNKTHLEQSGFIYLPPTPAFTELAAEFEDEILHILGDDAPEPNANRVGDREGNNELETFEVLDSESWEDGATFGGATFTQEEIDRIRTEVSKIKVPFFQAMPEGMQNQLMEEFKKHYNEKNS